MPSEKKSLCDKPHILRFFLVTGEMMVSQSAYEWTEQVIGRADQGYMEKCSTPESSAGRDSAELANLFSHRFLGRLILRP
jgi:hypothetical protein